MKRLIFIVAIIFFAATSALASPVVYNINFGLPNLSSIESPIRIMKHGTTDDFICGFSSLNTYNENELMAAMNSKLTAAGVTFAKVNSVYKYWQGYEYIITFRLTAPELIGDSRILKISNASSNTFEILVVSDDDGILNAYNLTGEWDGAYEDDFRLSISGSQYGVTYKLKRNGVVAKTFVGNGGPMNLGTFGEGYHGTYIVEASLIGYTSSNTNPVTMENRFGLSEENHIAVKTYDSPDGVSYIMDVSYYDGLGFPIQEIAVGGGTDNRSIVRPIEYDLMRRQTAREYLPFAQEGLSGGFVSDALHLQQDYYSSDSRPFIENIFEDGMSGRLLRSQKEGDVYENADKKVNITYGIHDGSDSIYKLNWNKSNTTRPVIANLGSYGEDELTYVRTVTEDNDTSMVFSDVFGNMVMSRRIDNGINHDTYYIYDLKDSLVCIIQPEGSALMPTSQFSFDGDFWQKYCFSYIYDSRGNMVERHIPGCGTEIIAYDQRSRPVLYADAMMLMNNISKYTIYDNKDRIIREGYIMGLASPEIVQESLYAGTEISSIIGQFAGMVTREMAYYSDETISTLPSYIPNDIRHAINFSYCKNLLAQEIIYEEPYAEGRLARWEPEYAKTRSYYYDNYSRPIVIYESDNNGWQSIYTYNYDFLGNVLQKTEEHRSNESVNTLTCNYTYDTRGRMTSITRTVNGQTMAPITYIYDNFGRLEVKEFFNSGHQFYGYDIRSNLTFNASAIYGEELFKQLLNYHSPHHPGSESLFGGFISEIEEEQINNSPSVTSCRYDHLGRLTSLTRNSREDQTACEYHRTSVTYDRNGNISSITLNEDGSNHTTNYVHEGNQIVSSISLDSDRSQYQYYPNGNLKTDSKLNLQFEYNLLNLPSVVSSLGGVPWARYAYLADGTKMYHKDIYHNGYIYRGSFVYRLENGVQRLESIGYEEGRIMATAHDDWGIASEFIDTWHVTDHLGNVRTVVDITDINDDSTDAEGRILEQNAYHPFGERIEDTDLILDDSNRYRFSGKEEQTFMNGTYSDFGARLYSSDIQRWTTPDPLAEKYYDLSPYAFCANNPINFVDPDGRSWYYNLYSGDFVAHIDDDDDYIYLVTPDEIQNANGDNSLLSLCRRDDNMFGQLALEGLLDKSIESSVISDLFNRANTDERGSIYVSIDVPILVNSKMDAYAQVITLTKNTIKSVEVNPQYVYRGYDSMLIFAHEIGHMIEIKNNIMNTNKKVREISADIFARGHWAYKKSSSHAKEILDKHENQYH